MPRNSERADGSVQEPGQRKGVHSTLISVRIYFTGFGRLRATRKLFPSNAIKILFPTGRKCKRRGFLLWAALRFDTGRSRIIGS